ncbi:MAG: TlpA family protein disulfide reductase [Phycisphaerae bacterium]|nr:TlpA family protein disulfide reductase [Phycisphaerae bacterium]
MRATHRTITGALAATLLVVACGRAATEPPTPSVSQPPRHGHTTPAPSPGRAKLEATAAAARGVERASYTATQSATGPFATLIPAVRGRVTLEPLADGIPFPAKFRVDLDRVGSPEPGRDGPPALFRVQVAFDGNRTTYIDHDARTYWVADAGGYADAAALSDAMGLLVWDLVVPEALELAEVKSVEVVGRQDIAGVPCDVLAIEIDMSTADELDPHEHAHDDAQDDDVPHEHAIPPLTVRHCVGVDDHLTRRVEYPLDTGDPAQVGSVIIEVSDLALNDAARGSPDLTPPEGYTKVDPPATDTHAEAGPTPLEIGAIAPPFSLPDSTGVERSLAEFAGRVVVLDFWATWCGPCKQTMPGLQNIHERFQGRPVSVIGISTNDDGEPAAYMKSKKYTYTLLLEGERISDMYGVGPIPHLIVLGADGSVLFQDIGYTPGHEHKLAEIIEAHLKSRGL